MQGNVKTRTLPKAKHAAPCHASALRFVRVGNSCVLFATRRTDRLPGRTRKSVGVIDEESRNPLLHDLTDQAVNGGQSGRPTQGGVRRPSGNRPRRARRIYSACRPARGYQHKPPVVHQYDESVRGTASTSPPKKMMAPDCAIPGGGGRRRRG